MTPSKTAVVIATAPELRPAALFTPRAKSAKRGCDFFFSQINNHNVPKAYFNATGPFAQWCA